MVLSDTQTPELRSWQINSLLFTFAFSKTIMKMNTEHFLLYVCLKLLTSKHASMSKEAVSEN